MTASMFDWGLAHQPVVGVVLFGALLAYFCAADAVISFVERRRR